MTSLLVVADDWLRLTRLVQTVTPNGLHFVPGLGFGSGPDTCANGTLMAPFGNTLAVCIMAPYSRLLIHTLVPLAEYHEPIDGLIALTQPARFKRVLPTYKGGMITIELAGERAFFHLPCAEGRRNISFPMRIIPGHMLAPALVTAGDPDITVCAREFLAALERVQQRIRTDTYRGMLSLVASPEGLALWGYGTQVVSHQLIEVTDSGAVDQKVQFNHKARHIRELTEIVHHMHLHQSELRLRVNDERLILFNSQTDVVIFSDVPAGQRPNLYVPLVPPAPHISQLLLEEQAFELDPETARTIRQLFKARPTDPYSIPPARWIISQETVEIILCSHQLTMHRYAACRCQSWNHDKNRLELDVDPEVTGAILQSIATIHGPPMLLYGRCQLTIRFPDSGFEILTRVDENVKPLPDATEPDVLAADVKSKER